MYISSSVIIHAILLDFDSHNIEPLRLLINRNNVSKIAYTFPTEVPMEVFPLPVRD